MSKKKKKSAENEYITSAEDYLLRYGLNNQMYAEDYTARENYKKQVNELEKARKAEQERQNRILSNYQMNRANPQPWVTGGRTAQLRQDAEAVRQQPEQRPTNFQDWNRFVNVMDPKSGFNQALQNRPEREQRYWDAVRAEYQAPKEENGIYKQNTVYNDGQIHEPVRQDPNYHGNTYNVQVRNINPREAEDRALAYYQMNRANPQPWVNGGKAEQLRQDAQRVRPQGNPDDQNLQGQAQAAKIPQNQNYKGFRYNLPDQNIDLSADQRAMQALKGSMGLNRVNPDDPKSVAGAYWGQRGGMQKMMDAPAMWISDQQLEAEIPMMRKFAEGAEQKERKSGERSADETAEMQAAIDEAGRRNHIYADLNEYGLPVEQMGNGKLYVPDPSEQAWNESPNRLRQRPEEYEYDDTIRYDYDRLIYDAVHGAGAYDAAIDEAETDEEIDAIDAETEDLWNKLETRGFDEEITQAADEHYDLIRQNNGDYNSRKYRKREKELEEEKERRAEVRRIEALAPDGDGEFIPENVNYGLFAHPADQLYYYANLQLGGEDVSDFRRYGNMRPESFMTEEQLKNFNNFFNSGDKDGALEYYNALKPYLDEIQLEFKSQLEAKMSTNGYAPIMIGNRVLTAPVAGIAGSIGTGLALLGNEDAGKRTSGWYSLSRTNMNIQNAQAQAVGEKFNEWFGPGADRWGQLLVGTVYSMADNLTAMAMTGGAAGINAGGMAGKLAEGTLQLIMSSEAASQNMVEKLDAGVDPTEAAISSIGTGAIEWITEKVSIEELLKPDVRELMGKPGEMIKYIAKNTIAEGTEEIASSGLGIVLDAALSTLYGHENEIEARVKELREADPNLSEEDALKQAWQETAEQTLMEGLAGAFSGLVMSGGRGALNRAGSFRNLGSNISAQGNQIDGKSGTQQLIDAAAGMTDTVSQRMAEDLQKKMGRGKTLSNYEIGQLAYNMMQDAGDQHAGIIRDTMQNRIKSELMDAGMVQDRAAEAAAAMAKSLSGEQLTDADMQAISKDERAINLWKEYNSSKSKQMEMRYEIDTASEGVRSVADLVSDLADKSGRATSAVAADVAQSIRNTGSMDEAIDDFAHRNSFLMSEQFAEKAKELLKTSKSAQASKNYLDDAMKIRISAMSLATSLPQTHLDRETAQALWNEAKAEFDEAEAQRVLNHDKLPAGKGIATFNGAEFGTDAWKQALKDTAGLSGTAKLQMTTIGELAQRMGLKVNFINDSENKYVYGWEDAGTGAITINVAGQETSGLSHHMLTTMSHEMTHWLEQNSSEGYASLRQFVVDHLRESGVDVEQRMADLIANQNAIMKGSETGELLDLNGAMAEIVAQGCEELLSSQALRDKLQTENKSLYGRIKEYAVKFIRRLDAAIRGMENSSSREARQLRQWREDIAKIWLGAQEEAMGRAAGGTTKDGKIQMSVAMRNASLTDVKESYETAIRNGNDAAAREALDAYAAKQGYTDRAYHGTSHFGFTKIDIDQGDGTFFVAYNPELASTYTKTGDVKNITDRELSTMSGKELAKYVQGISEESGEGIEGIRYNPATKDFSVTHTDEDGNSVTETYSREDLENMVEGYREYDESLPEGDRSRALKATQEGIYDLYTRPGKQLVVDAKGSSWRAIPFHLEDYGSSWEAENGSMPEPSGWKTRDIAAWAKENGYDSVRINNVYDNGMRREGAIGFGDIGIFFDGNDVKSADLITQDDSGKEIGIGDRFNDRKADIRYSVVDKTGKEIKLTQDELDSNKKAISEMDFVADIPKNNYTKNENQDMKTMGVNYFNSIGNKATNKILGEIKLNESGVQHLVRWLTARRAGLIEAIKPVIENGELINITEKAGRHKFDSATIAAPVMFEGKPYYMAVIIRQDGEKQNSYYFHDALLINENVGQAPLNKSLTAKALGADPTIVNVLQTIPAYNGKNGISEYSAAQAEEDLQKAIKNPKNSFSMANVVETNKAGLIAVHNLTERNLMDTLAEGGFTAPSIAIIRAEMNHNKYGEISVVFKPESVDPKSSQKNKVYGTDAWTPTRSNAQIETRLNYEPLQNAKSTIENILKDNGTEWHDEAMNWINHWLYEDQTTDTMDEMIDRAYRNGGMIAAYNLANGKTIERKTTNVKVHPDIHEQFMDIYNGFLEKLEEKGMLQEFMDDMKSKSGNYNLDKYMETFRESGEQAASLAEKYDNNPKGLPKKAIWARMKASSQFQEDGREILWEDEFDRQATINAARENINKKDFDKWVENLLKGALGEKGIYNGTDPYTYDGRRRTFRQTHWQPTVENIVKAMYRNHDAKGGEAGGATGLMAKASKEYRNLNEIRADSDRLKQIDPEEYNGMINELDQKIRDFAENISNTSGTDLYTIRSMLIDAGGEYAKNGNAQAISRYFSSQGIKLTEEQLNTARSLMDEAREIPTGYFEAKPERVVDFSEIDKIIVPDDTSEALLSELEKRNIPYETYDGTDEGRMRALNQQENARFSVAQPDMDVISFMEGLNENNMATAQEKTMVRQFKELRAAMDLARHALDDRTRKLRELEAKQNPSAYDRSEMQRMRILVQNSADKLDRLEKDMIRATGDKGYARMMSQQSAVMDNLVSGRTADAVQQTVEALTKDVEALTRDMDERQKKINNLRMDLSFRERAALVDMKQAENVAGLIRKEYGSSINKRDLVKGIAEIRLMIAAGQNIDEAAEELAWKIAAKTKGEGSVYLDMLRGKTLVIGPGAMKELKGQNSSLKEVRSALAGTGIKVKAGTTGTLDSEWSELCDMIPSLNRDTGEKDQLDEFLRLIRSEKASLTGETMYEGHIAEVAEDLKGWIASVGTTTGTKQDPEAVKLLAQMNEMNTQQLAEVRKQMAQLLKDGRLAMQMTDSMQRDVEKSIEYNNLLAEQSEAAIWKQEKWKLKEQLQNEKTQALLAEQAKWKERIEKDKRARDMMKNNMQLRKAIHTNVSRIRKLLINETDLKNIPEHMKGLAREMLGMIVTNDITGRKITGIAAQDLLETNRILGEMTKQDGEFNPDDLRMITDEEAQSVVMDALADLEDGIAFYNASTGGGIIANLQAFHNALDRIADAVTTIVNVIHAEQSINIGDRKIAVADAAEEIAQDMQQSRFKGELQGAGSKQLRSAKRAVVTGNETPVYFFKNLRNRGMMQQWQEMKRGENRNGMELQKAQDFMRGLAEETNYKAWADEKHTVKIGSRNVEMTVGNMMELYAIWRREKESNPQMSNHLANGGVFIQSEDRSSGLLRRETQEQRPVKVTDEDVQGMYAMLTPEQKNYLDKVVGYLSSDMSDLGNEASMRMYGIRKYKEKWYFPMKVWDGVKSARSDRGISGSNENRAAHKGWSKRRIHRASNALVIGDFTQDAVNHIVEMINYNTMAPAIENMNKILNYQRTEANEEGDPYSGAVKRNIRVMFQQAYGKDALNYLETFMQDLNGGMVQDQRSSLRDKALTMFKKNAVAGSMSVALQQPLSYIRAGMMINPKYLAAAISPAMWKGSYAEMNRYSGVAVIKNMGRFDMQMGASAKEYVAPEKKQTAYGWISDKLTALPEMMDRMTWTRMWSAVKLEQHAKNPQADMKSEEFLKKCAERFNDVMQATQVYDSVMVKSSNMRSSKTSMKVLTSFMAEPTVTLNVLADAVRNVNEKGGKLNLAKAGMTFVLSAVLQAAVKGAMGSGRTPDDRRTWLENFLYKFEQNLMGEMDVLNLVPGAGDLVELIRNGKLSDDSMTVLGKIGSSFEKLWGIAENGNWNDYRSWEDSVGQLAQLFTNIPAKNLMRDGRAMYNWITQEPYAARENSGAVMRQQAKAAFWTADNLIGAVNARMKDAGYQTTNKAYYSRLYDAMQAGNEKEAADIREYLGLINGQDAKAIASGLRSQAKAKMDPAEASRWAIDQGIMGNSSTLTSQYKAGDISRDEYTEMMKQLDPEMEDNDLWWKTDQIEYEKATGKEAGGKYYRLWDAMDGNKADEIGDAVKNMTAHGMEAKNIKTEIGKHYKAAYLEGNSEEKRKIRDAMQKAYKKLGFMAEDADKTISKWK